MTINFNDKKEVSKVAYQIIMKYCRKYKHGHPIKCNAPHEEEVLRDTKRYKKIKSKYIFDSEAIAIACARELQATLRFRPMRAYMCHRSKHGHCHLTSRKDK